MITTRDTSRAAYDGIQETITEKQFIVYQTIATAMHGLADHELVVLVGGRMGPSTARTRRNELVTMGLLIQTGEIRRTESGNPAVVWAVKA